LVLKGLKRPVEFRPGVSFLTSQQYNKRKVEPPRHRDAEKTGKERATENTKIATGDTKKHRARCECIDLPSTQSVANEGSIADPCLNSFVFILFSLSSLPCPLCDSAVHLLFSNA
jgi:hypothetical protein